MNPDMKIARMNTDEVQIAIDWANVEGWNPGLHDAECFYHADPQGFFVGKIDTKIIATISAVAYDDNFSFLGLYIVKPEYRNCGYGNKIMLMALDYLKNRISGLMA